MLPGVYVLDGRGQTVNWLTCRTSNRARGWTQVRESASKDAKRRDSSCDNKRADVDGRADEDQEEQAIYHTYIHRMAIG